MRAFIILAFLCLAACARGGTPIPAHVAREFILQTRTLLAGQSAIALTQVSNFAFNGAI